MSKFTPRARTVEMLERQQIAGIPTAINEFFKNAHDAYADVVEVDYYRPEQLFVLRERLQACCFWTYYPLHQLFQWQIWTSRSRPGN